MVHHHGTCPEKWWVQQLLEGMHVDRKWLHESNSFEMQQKMKNRWKHYVLYYKEHNICLCLKWTFTLSHNLPRFSSTPPTTTNCTYLLLMVGRWVGGLIALLWELDWHFLLSCLVEWRQTHTDIPHCLRLQASLASLSMCQEIYIAVHVHYPGASLKKLKRKVGLLMTSHEKMAVRAPECWDGVMAYTRQRWIRWVGEWSSSLRKPNAILLQFITLTEHKCRNRWEVLAKYSSDLTQNFMFAWSSSLN